MPRTEHQLNTNWKFATGEYPEDNSYKSVILPHDWVVNAPFDKEMRQGADQGYRNRWSIGWYKRTLTLAKKRKDYRYFLDFGGVYENSTVWVNNREVGGWKYGYTPFRIDVSDDLHEGDNHVAVKVDNTAFPADRWYSGGGIYRTVKLIEVPKNHFNELDIIVQSKIEGDSAVVSVHTGVSGMVKAVLSGYGVDYEAIGEGILELHLTSPKLWSADEPNLYTLTLSLLDGEPDTISLQIGIREIEMRAKKGMYVNGKKVILKGVCLHQDVGCRGIAAKKEIWRERLTVLKNMGCNCIRPSHHLFSSEFLDMCDEMGFYVYEEPFDKWKSGSYARYFEENWQADVAAMVKRDRNRPCIFIWGAGNEVENQGHESMLDMLKNICDYIKSLDNTRPVTYAMNPHFKRESGIDAAKVEDIQKFVDTADDSSITNIDEKMKRIKRIADIVDVISCNYQDQWYLDIHRHCPDKLILGSEVFQFFGGHPQQIKNYTLSNPSLVPFKADYVIGAIIWTGYDYLGESMGYPAKGWSGALLRTNGEKRFSAHIMESYWSEKPMVRFAVMDYSLADEGVKEQWDMPICAEHWHFPQFTKVVVPYMIASNCDEVALYLNKERFCIPKPTDCANGIITGFLPYLPGKVEVIGYREGKEACRHSVVTPSAAVALQFDKPTQTINAEANYELLLTVRAVDKDGNPYFRESCAVRFVIEGTGEILAVDNGNLMANEPYNETAIHMYHGCASVQLRLNGEKGRVAVHAYAEGMTAGKAIVAAG